MNTLFIPNKKTKIIATYGPSCSKIEVIRDMIQQGVDVFRLNASHNSDKKYLKKIVTTIRKEAEKAGRYIGIFLDLQGPKIRVGKFKNEKIRLVENTYIEITTDPILGDEKCFSVDYPNFIKDIKVNDALFINDGKTRVVVESIKEKSTL